MRAIRRSIVDLLAILTLGCAGKSTTDASTTGGASGSTAGGASGSSTAGGASGSSTAGGASGSSTAGGAGAGIAGAGGQTGACPARPPPAASACTQPASTTGLQPQTAQCSWGDDPRAECRTTALCQSNKSWAITAPASSCISPSLPAACPELASGATGQCPDSALTCYYGDGARCACSNCPGAPNVPLCRTSDPLEWVCQTPPTGCPAFLPQAGSACSVEGQQCGPSCELAVICEQGLWAWRRGECPICAAPDTPIATPTGDIPISELRPGDIVYSINAHGIVAVPILRVGKTRVFAHHVMQVELDSGAVLRISPGHPTADGRTFGELRAGTALDPLHTVVRAELVPYGFDATYDILPASDTGLYFAAGTAIGSTLNHQ